ncbi:unnamed protein product [Clavelina lepadiformis]|uniref:Calcineurin-like phosphoesterase domain-containing protein n=1 Tax=Clavelina lepadiformis TaxID=159417 RepID=A0ABP0FTN7_CLALP
MLVPLDYFFKFLRKTSRIKFFSPRKVSLFVVVTVTLCSVMAFQTAVQAPRIISVEVPIAKLAPSMDKMRIGLISDIHLGPTVGYTQLKRVVDMTNALNPDIVVFSGDLMDATLADVDGAATPLAELKAPYGKYFATGNHEYYTGDIENWFKALESYGFIVLHNSNRKILSKSNPNDWICILGTDDIQADQIRYEGHGMDLKKAYKGCDLSHPAILIAHQPKAAQIALDSEFNIQLILSGHTHGGQMYPIIWLCYLVNPFMSGLYHPKEGSYVYVSQGSVYYGFPLRWGTYPEITNITLRAT